MCVGVHRCGAYGRFYKLSRCAAGSHDEDEVAASGALAELGLY